jgi:hypothetical protein
MPAIKPMTTRQFGAKKSAISRQYGIARRETWKKQFKQREQIYANFRLTCPDIAISAIELERVRQEKYDELIRLEADKWYKITIKFSEVAKPQRVCCPFLRAWIQQIDMRDTIVFHEMIERNDITREWESLMETRNKLYNKALRYRYWQNRQDLCCTIATEVVSNILRWDGLDWFYPNAILPPWKKITKKDFWQAARVCEVRDVVHSKLNKDILSVIASFVDNYRQTSDNRHNDKRRMLLAVLQQDRECEGNHEDDWEAKYAFGV